MNTLYSTDYVYVHLSNNDLLQIPYNQTLSSETPISTLAPPPDGSTMVISSPFAQSVLYAISGHSVNYYDPVGDVWHVLSSSDAPWCSDATPFAPPNLQQGILFYGGSCSSNQVLYSFNTSTKATQQLESSVHPLGFADAAYTNIDYATTVFVGGNTSTSVWVGMNQVAYFQGGWNYRNVDNFGMLDSRSGALLLPIFPASYSLSSDSRADRALILGGTVDGRTAQPYSAVLEFGDQGWGYHGNASFEVEGGIVGAALLFETLVTIGKGDVSKEAGLHVQEKSLEKRSLYSIQLYNVNNLEPVQKYVPSQAATSVLSTSTTISQATSTSAPTAAPTTSTSPSSDSSKHSGMSTGGIAALSTILPLAAIIALLGIWWYRKKKTSDVQLPRERLDYFDDFMPRDRDMSDANSLNSWTEKRRIWESDLNRNSILSNKDLVNRDSVLDPNLPLPSPPRPARKASVKSAYSYDDNVNDVQVLVSSRRRTQLRVVNADEDLIDL